ncbi:MAG: hypothetical protein ABJB97_07150, partial [Acidobacteriota bacterium]
RDYGVCAAIKFECAPIIGAIVVSAIVGPAGPWQHFFFLFGTSFPKSSIRLPAGNPVLTNPAKFRK